MSVLISQEVPNHAVLSDNAVQKYDTILGEESFGIVKHEYFHTIGLHCAVKGKGTNRFNAVFEARALAVLQGVSFYSYVYRASYHHHFLEQKFFST